MVFHKIEAKVQEHAVVTETSRKILVNWFEHRYFRKIYYASYMKRL